MAAEFPHRHIGPRGTDVHTMLERVGHPSLESLIDAAVPESIRSAEALDLRPAASEPEVLDELRALADRNQVSTSLIGMGYADTHTPGVIARNVLENPAWYTAYTPYQPEISQGRLEALLNFQTMVSDLTGMDLANASLLDEGTAAAEAMTMMGRLVKGESTRFFVDRDCHPQTIAVVETRAEPLGIDVIVGDAWSDDLDAEQVSGVLMQYPGSSGEIRDPSPVIDQVHEAGGLVSVATDLLACTLLTPPGELGADIVVGNSQRFGVPLGFGGPHAAFIACREAHKRSLPGRLVGVSVDTGDRPALRLALQTREQHIRREKATSNICTAQVLLAVMASMYAVYHGPDGLTAIAQRVQGDTGLVAGVLRRAGIEVVNEHFFDTVTVRVPGRAAEIHARARDAGINLRSIDEDTVGVSLDETTTHTIVEQVLEIFEVGDGATRFADPGLPEALRRSSSFLTHPVFHTHRSETEMLRYLRKLADKDIALDRAMIPLGSCTMKLNATAEMEAVSWPEFGRIHPFAPVEQTEGYRALIDDLCEMLVEVTGYAAVSIQPNAGSQGELAGLLAIRGWHQSRGEGERRICLIPESAHGTNAASAVMAGMNVVVIKCDDAGNVDVDDLKQKVVDHADDLAALMVTYPSTHGVFERTIGEICDLVHQYGGQVYLDGANLNALVGLAKPGQFGADVSHLNLHKTFCIPHGGGGPGVGPVGVGAHLAPFLPNHPLDPGAGPETGCGPISAAPFGSASILPISWAYCRLMGAQGLTSATEMAILNANYVAARLGDAYPVLYSGEGGLVAHECILDVRTITKETGVTVDDIAKRLIDYGFHAPTMSFPVAGTLMVEPTESESLAELDRFCDAMLAIRAEIAAIESGAIDHGDSALAHAPHAAEDLLVAAWDRAYTREEAAYAGTKDPSDKYWPPVSRIDGGYGDRNLVCSCPPIEDYTG